MEVAITKISPNGQVVIPSEVRKDANIGPSTKFLVFNHEDTIILRKIGPDFESELLKRVIESEEQIKAGRSVVADSRMSAKEMEKLVQGYPKKRKR